MRLEIWCGCKKGGREDGRMCDFLAVCGSSILFK